MSDPISQTECDFIAALTLTRVAARLLREAQAKLRKRGVDVDDDETDLFTAQFHAGEAEAQLADLVACRGCLAVWRGEGGDFHDNNQLRAMLAKGQHVEAIRTMDGDAEKTSPKTSFPI